MNYRNYLNDYYSVGLRENMFLNAYYSGVIILKFVRITASFRLCVWNNETAVI